jgi:hypothetical protein
MGLGHKESLRIILWLADGRNISKYKTPRLCSLLVLGILGNVLALRFGLSTMNTITPSASLRQLPLLSSSLDPHVQGDHAPS